MKRQPLISFCIATYKRQELLKSTIDSILKQDYNNLEIVVSDNDPWGSAKQVINDIHSEKIIYHKNKKNLGMVENFNTAYRHSHGDYIIFIADDDPPEPSLLAELTKLRQKYPKAGSYFGAADYLVKDPLISKLHHGLKIGKNPQTNKHVALGKINIINSDEFLPKFLRYEILNYFLWSCGMVRRDIVEKAGGFKTMNGSNFLTDYAYILRVGSLDGMVVINKAIGSQLIHKNNFGRSNKNLLTLKNAVKGFYDQSIKQSQKLNCRKDLEKFLRDWVKGELLGVLRFRRLMHEKEDRRFIIEIYRDIANRYNFIKQENLYFYSRAFFPALMELFDKYKWIFEKRNFRLLINRTKGLTKAT